MAPVSASRSGYRGTAVLQAGRDPRHLTGDLPGHERLAAAFRLVVEEDTVAGIHAVRLAVVDRDPVRVELGDPYGERGDKTAVAFLGDRSGPAAEDLGGRGLVEPTRSLLVPRKRPRVDGWCRYRRRPRCTPADSNETATCDWAPRL